MLRQRRLHANKGGASLGILGAGFSGNARTSVTSAVEPPHASQPTIDSSADVTTTLDPTNVQSPEPDAPLVPPMVDVPRKNGSLVAAPLALAEVPVSADSRKVKVDILGPVRVLASGREVSFGRAEGRDMFALLATSNEGELTQTIIDTLWPDEGERGARRLESAIRDVNAAMRHATGLAAEVRFVVKTGMRRRLSAAYFDVDWWRFEDAYRRASSTADDATRMEALRLMVGLYQGELLDGRDDLWCVSPRQAAMTQAVNAAARLAELERKTDPDRALDVLTHAVERVDRHSELLWCQLMMIQGELGRLPALRRSFELLTVRLSEIDAKPSAPARQIFQKFLN
ncbi:hypothetical protein Acor_40850 [Acrocarpospora corrugata]|uniref:Bacterial transcriptional activator domain-containing protein n=2 Tax=Acrocarpospora corrugata TaxID=35763 RepID=A0A5M3W1B6_9ACTN|nr:hypothetical protein Acor_40850 [Acrocarpospora corrugata]